MNNHRRMSRRILPGMLPIVIALLILMAISAIASPEPVLIREAEYVVQQQGTPVGYEIYRKYETPEGYLYTNEAVVYVRLLDGSWDKGTYSYETYVDKSYNPILHIQTSVCSLT